MAADETRGYRQLPPRDGYSDTLVRRRLVIETQSYNYIDRREFLLACLTVFLATALLLQRGACDGCLHMVSSALQAEHFVSRTLDVHLLCHGKVLRWF